MIPAITRTTPIFRSPLHRTLSTTNPTNKRIKTVLRF